MIEHRAETSQDRFKHLLYEMTDKEKEIFAPFLKTFERKNGQETVDGGSVEKKETDSPEFNVELAKELDRYEDVYMNPVLYGKVSKAEAILRGVIPGLPIGPNCQAFALKMPVRINGELLGARPYPGFYAGLKCPYRLMEAIRNGDKEYAKKEMARLIGEDVKAMGGQLVEVSKDYQCAEGEWKICMMASTKLEDYHFMRQGENAWFHKVGVTRVSCFDKNYKLITDPEHCKTDYDQFLGYYVVRGVAGKENWREE